MINAKFFKIKLNGTEYDAIFDINVIDEIQDKYDISFTDFFELFKDDRKIYKVTKFLITETINEATKIKNFNNNENEKMLEEYVVGMMLGFDSIYEMAEFITEQLNQSLPDVDENTPSTGKQ